MTNEELRELLDYALRISMALTRRHARELREKLKAPEE